jgi:hypothetical protein
MARIHTFEQQGEFARIHLDMALAETRLKSK